MTAEFHELQVSGIVQETKDTRSYLFEIPAHLKELFRYKAGQFLTFEVPWNGMRLRRCYSLASAPESDPWLKVTVKRVDEGRISNWFNDELNVGDSIDVEVPQGRFTLHSGQTERGLVLFGGGSGITPVISLMKSALRTTDRKVKLVYANRDTDSIIFKDEIDLWLAQYPGRLEVVHHLDSERGFLTVDQIRQLFAGWEDSEFYVCGPTAFMDAVEASFKSAGIEGARTKFERFLSPTDPDRQKQSAQEVPEQAPGDVPAEFKMILEGQEHVVPYEVGATLLTAAEKVGHKPPSSCEDGYCGCCMALLKSGQVNMQAHEALTEDDIERGWILTCQARPCSKEELEIDYDAEY